MPQPLGGGVLIPTGPAVMLVRGERVVVEAIVEEYLFGDSCVLIETGDRRSTSKFWVPTRRIHRVRLDQLTPVLAPDVPGYPSDDAAQDLIQALRPAAVTKL